jgi:hypothetical protein
MPLILFNLINGSILTISIRLLADQLKKLD